MRFVNVVDLFRLQPVSEHPHGSTEREFDGLFTTDKPIVFVASGTGFAPIKSLIEEALHQGVQRPMVLYWGGRKRADLYREFCVKLPIHVISLALGLPSSCRVVAGSTDAMVRAGTPMEPVIVPGLANTFCVAQAM